ncbi:MAG: hypothetical protein KAJ55_14345 [Anaerolineales bacterium]|nr:hypothetical protein [Anaerolineales bacterium]
MSILGKIKQDRKKVVESDFAVLEDAWSEMYPGVFEMLARTAFQGKARRLGRLVFYAETNRATLVLCDVDAGMVTFYAAETFGEALVGLEGALQAGSCDWRKDKRSR